MTNADKIRQMTDEELAAWLKSIMAKTKWKKSYQRLNSGAESIQNMEEKI